MHDVKFAHVYRNRLTFLFVEHLDKRYVKDAQDVCSDHAGSWSTASA